MQQMLQNAGRRVQASGRRARAAGRCSISRPRCPRNAQLVQRAQGLVPPHLVPRVKGEWSGEAVQQRACEVLAQHAMLHLHTVVDGRLGSA